MQASSDLPKQLKSIADKLNNLSQALHLAHPRDVMRFADELKSKLKETTSEVQQWAKPFAVILEQISLEICKLAHDNPDRLDLENLQKQLALIEHFVEKGLLFQAVVSWIALQKGDGDWLKKDHRKEIENALGETIQKLREQQASVPEFSMPKSKEIVSLWDQIVQLRNDLAHCGMSEHAVDLQTIKKRAENILQQLKALVQ